MSLSVIYGNKSEYTNITDFVLQHCIEDNTLIIPKCARSDLFGDLLFQEDKSITIKYKQEKFTTCEDIKLDISDCLNIKCKKEELVILYGVNGFYTDVTAAALDKCSTRGILFIPPGDDNRDVLFGDPVFGTLKHVKVLYKGKWRFYSDKEKILLDVTGCVSSTVPLKLEEEDIPCVKLAKIHSQLRFLYGHLYDEYPEQLLIVKYLKKNNRVLEMGSNIGRATSIIASILENQENLVTLECDSGTFKKLLANRENNHFKYRAENAALSYKPLLLKSQDCISFTINSALPVAGYNKVKTITYEDLEAKYNITFDTLIIDCEGAFHYILLDNPNILNNINLIIMENDYRDIKHKNSVDKVMREKGLVRTYFECGGWGPCYENFYEVWERLD